LLISLFIACYNDLMFADTGKAVVTVLERLGHTVEFRKRTNLLRPDALQYRFTTKTPCA